MYRLLKFIRAIRRGRRQFLRILPMPVRAGVNKTLEYVNFFRLAPVLAGMLLVPRHFFRNLHSIVRGKNSLYPTPLAIITAVAFLVLLIDLLVPVPAPIWWIAATLVVIALFGPVFTLIFAFIVRSAKRKGMRFGDGWEDLLLSRAAFKQLNRRLYLQGLFYFAIYFLMIMPVVLLVPAVRFGIPDLLKLIPNLDADVADRMDTLLKLMAAGMAAWIASGTIVRPLGILFVSCVDVPEPRFYEIEFGRLKDKIEDAFTEHGQRREKLVQELRQEWAYVMAELRKQELRVKHHSPERIPEMLLNRAQAAPAIAGFPVLFDDDPDPTMIRDYERIRHSEPVVVCWTVKYGDRRDVPQFSRLEVRRRNRETSPLYPGSSV